MELKIPIEIVFDDVNSVIDELGKLQKYKLGEGDDMTLVDVDDVADVLTRHVKAREAKCGTRWIPCSERLPSENSDILVTYAEKDEKRIVPVNYGRGTWFDCVFNMALNPVGVLAWMPLPEPYGGDDK